MSDPTPNERQRELIESTEGIYRVDAGAGTGKTLTITKRYANILRQETTLPEDILLVTFTRSAAEEMRDRIVRQTEYDLAELQHAPINTFHAFALRLLKRYGHDAPQYLGIDDRLPSSVDVVEDSVRERRLFREFLSMFEDAHPEYSEYTGLLRDRGSLASLLAELASRGIVPRRDGWYRNSRQLLAGDREAFFEAFDRTNEPVRGANGYNNSDARGAVSSWDGDEYPSDAPNREELHADPRVDREWVERAYDEDRDGLFAFVHDLYFEYLQFLVRRNTLTQGFVLVFAFTLLCENDVVREAVNHRYVMVDEFQDTNEIQFKLTLLLAATNNLCVVGDWKQSIYGFQYTSVENIREFSERIGRYARELNVDRPRIRYDVSNVETMSLKQSYRATQSLLDTIDQTLTIPATKSESVEEIDVDGLEATNFVDNTRIEAYHAGDELDLVLDRIQTIVDNEAYAVETADEPDPGPEAEESKREKAERDRLGAPSPADIGVLTRKRAFARELLRRAEEYGVPIAYEGGLRVFDTPEAKLILAWLRICENDDDRGWAVVLERAGYSLSAAEEILAEERYPEEMVAFREELNETRGVGGLARTVLDRYRYRSIVGDALVGYLTETYDEGLDSRGEVVRDIVSKLEADATVEVDTSSGRDAVTLQTIHGAKGLEYPIVILANINNHVFPHYGRGPDSQIVYEDNFGVRQRRRVEETPLGPSTADHWQYDLLSKVQPSSYDEERRLFYVGTSRARRHLVLTAGEDPSSFFEGFPIEAEKIDPSPEQRTTSTEIDSTPEHPVEATQSHVRTGVHEIMDESVHDDKESGRGAEFGQAVHDFAEAYAEGAPTRPDGADQRHVAAFVDRFDGDLRAEEFVLLPLDTDPRIVLTGIVDFLHVGPDRVSIVDWKTDSSRSAHDEYRLQLSVYYHILTEVFPDRDVRPIVFYTQDDEAVTVDPVSLDEINRRAEESVRGRGSQTTHR